MNISFRLRKRNFLQKHFSGKGDKAVSLEHSTESHFNHIIHDDPKRTDFMNGRCDTHENITHIVKVLTRTGYTPVISLSFVV